MLNGVYNNSMMTQPVQTSPVQAPAFNGVDYGAGLASGANQVLGQPVAGAGALPGQATTQADLGQGLFQTPAAAQQNTQGVASPAAGQTGAVTDPLTGVSMPQNMFGVQPQGQSMGQLWGDLFQTAYGQNGIGQAAQPQNAAQAVPAGAAQTPAQTAQTPAQTEQAPAQTGQVTVQEVTDKTSGPKGNEAPKGDITKKQADPAVDKASIGSADAAALKEPAAVDAALPINPEDAKVGDKIVLKGALKYLPEENTWIMEAGGKKYEIFGLAEEHLKDGAELELIGTVKEGRPDLDADFGFDVEEVKAQEAAQAEAAEAAAVQGEAVEAEAVEAAAEAAAAEQVVVPVETQEYTPDTLNLKLKEDVDSEVWKQIQEKYNMEIVRYLEETGVYTVKVPLETVEKALKELSEMQELESVEREAIVQG
jgi:hypothetical protein